MNGAGFEEAQFAVIDEGLKGAVATVVEAIEEDTDVFWADHVGKWLVALRLDYVPVVPLMPYARGGLGSAT